MHTTSTLCRAGLAGIAMGAALSALTATPANAGRATAEVAGHVDQVALVDGTGEQLEFKSKLNSTAPVVTDGGRYVVFSTGAPLVASDDNQVDDVYLRDTLAGATYLVSGNGSGPGDDASFEPTISADGRYVAFATWAGNLTRDRNGDNLDILVKDIQNGRFARVSVTSDEHQLGAHSFFPVISGDGRSVSFQTTGRFGPRDDDRREDVYVRDLDRKRTFQASLRPDGGDIRESVLNGDLSDDGTRVVFGDAEKLWMRDLATATTIRLWQEPIEPPCQPNPMGSAGRPTISGDGRLVAFASCATALPREDGEFTDVYTFNLRTGKISRVTANGNDYSFLPSLSRTGRFVGFGSEASDLVAGDGEGQPDAFVVDRRTGEVVRASQTSDGTGGNSYSAVNEVSISPDGASLAFQSYSQNLVAGDAFDLEEALVWRR